MIEINIRKTIKEIVQEIVPENKLLAIGLTGSYANNSYDETSDVDILCITCNIASSDHIIIRDKYYVINIVDENYINELFRHSNLHISEIHGYSYMKIIYERERGFLDNIITQARDKIGSLQYETTKAKEEFIAWLEEVQKAISGYKSNDHNKMLQGIHGLSFGMFNTLKYYYNIIPITDNEFFDKIVSFNDFTRALKKTSLLAFGLVEVSGIKERIENGFQVFKAVSSKIYPSLSKREKEYLDLLANKIDNLF